MQQNLKGLYNISGTSFLQLTPSVKHPFPPTNVNVKNRPAGAEYIVSHEQNINGSESKFFVWLENLCVCVCVCVFVYLAEGWILFFNECGGIVCKLYLT